MELAYFSYCDKTSLKDKYAASRRLKEYAEYFEKVYVFCSDKKIGVEIIDNIYYIGSPLWIYPLFSTYWTIKYLHSKKSKIAHVKIMDGFLGGLTGYFASKILKSRAVIRLGARMKENARYGLTSSNNNLFIKLKYAAFYLILTISEPFVFKRCKRFVCNSQAIVPKHIKNFKIIYNGIDIREFRKIESSKLKKELRLNPKLITLGMHGGVAETKGIYYLVEALKPFEGKINFIIVGDGPLLDYCKKKIPWGKYVGFINGKEIVDYINCFDVEILPTIKEGNDSFPNSLLEAMACEKVVIGTRTGGIPEMITNKHDGLLIEPNSTQEIIKAIQYILKNKKVLKNIGLNARKKILKQFNINVQTKKLIECLFN